MSSGTQSQLLTETDFDVVIVGTDLPQAILAAALSIAGSRVLHLDSNEFYGGKWATVQLSLLESVIFEAEQDTHDQGTSLHTSQQLDSAIGEYFSEYELQPFLSLSLHDQLFPLGVRRLPCSRSAENLSSIQSCLLDLVPRPIMSAGNMIELLVRTNVGHYVDFRAIDALYVQFTGSTGLRRVPGSRADVFQNSFITMPEKRLMMRYVTRCYESISAQRERDIDANESCSENDEDENVSLQEDMDTMRLTPKLQTFLTQSILFSVGDAQFSKREGMNRVYEYQASVMRFGTKTPFLYPNFGTGELSQAFCRLCAVHGGTYVLRRRTTGLVKPKVGGVESSSKIDEHRLGIITNTGDIVRTKHVFIPRALKHREKKDPPDVWHAIVVLDDSVLKPSQPERVMITIPRETLGNNTSAVRMRQLDSSVMVCPQGIYILYAETIEEGGTEQDLIRVLESYVSLNTSAERKQENANSDDRNVSDNRGTNRGETDSRAHVAPNCLWGISFARPHVKSETVSTEHVAPMSVSEREHDANNPVLEAQKFFKLVHPEGEFLPSKENEGEHKGNGSAYPDEITSDATGQNAMRRKLGPETYP
ncbi:unnamed protein product [Agarophyton chilense]